jgi:heat-inducible transcriptional repressor
MLAKRTGNILDIIVGEYISMARPVGSEAIVERHGLGVSSATVRNEMARLEDEGYIIRPHISGGAIPSDKGYRHYVESVIREAEEIPLDEQRMLSHLFHQVEQELSEWTHLAASLLARMVCSVAIVTSPKALSCRIKHLELVALQDSLALLILLLQEARLKKQMVAFDGVISQGELSAISAKLGTMFQGLTVAQLLANDEVLSPIEQHIKNAVVQVMAEEDRRRYEEPYIEGLRHMLTQPEFTHTQNMLRLVEMLESRDMVRSLLSEMVVDGGVRIVIGAENCEDAMKGYSMVVTQYGVPGEVNGALGVIGPTRMPYGRAISSVRYVGSLLSELVTELYIGP